MGVEHEAKLDFEHGVTEEEIRRVVRGYTFGSRKQKLQLSIYYDLADRLLTYSGIGLRFRSDIVDGKALEAGIWALKLPLPYARSGAMRRIEEEERGTSLVYPASLGEVMSQVAPFAELEELARLRTDRTAVEVLDSAGMAILEIDIDDVEVLTPSRLKFCEVELEARTEEGIVVCDEMVEELTSYFGATVGEVTKLERALSNHVDPSYRESLSVVDEQFWREDASFALYVALSLLQARESEEALGEVASLAFLCSHAATGDPIELNALLSLGRFEMTGDHSAQEKRAIVLNLIGQAKVVLEKLKVTTSLNEDLKERSGLEANDPTALLGDEELMGLSKEELQDYCLSIGKEFRSSGVMGVWSASIELRRSALCYFARSMGSNADLSYEVRSVLDRLRSGNG